jgi:thioredoxin reductase (NADPH)
VVGGGNTALQDALFLADICKSVTVIHRRDTFRGDPILVEKLKVRNNVTFLMECEISALHGEGSLAGMSVRNVKTGETKEIAVTGLFEAVGQLPEKELTAPLVKLDKSGFIAAGESCLTNVPGVFAAGDCRAKEVRQLTTACADGAVAALAAVQYCE